MEPLGHLETLIGRVVERVFHGGSRLQPADLFRVARGALLQSRRAWFGRDIAPNSVEIRANPASCETWWDVRQHLERELGVGLEWFAREQGLDLMSSVQVQIIADEGLARGQITARTALVEASPLAPYQGRLVTPSGWTFTGRRPLRRAVLLGAGRLEHLIVFGSHLVVGTHADADLCPPPEHRVRSTLLTLAGGLFASQPDLGLGWRPRGRHQRLAAGAMFRLARGCAGKVRVVTREGEVRSATISSGRWTFTLAAGEVLVGSDPQASDLFLFDKAVSARHGRLAAMAGGLEVEDLGSTNGLILNGRTVGQACLGPGDRLTLGTTDLVVFG